MKTISLKWKALWRLSLVLAAIIVGLTWLSHSEQHDQFEAAQAMEEALYMREIKALLRQIEARLQHLANWLPALEGMRHAVLSEDPQALETLFEHHWPAAQLDYDLQSVSFFSTQGHLISRWNDGAELPPIPLQWVTKVAAEEQPLFALICTNSCYHVGVLPLLVQSQTAGILVLTSSVAELIVRFRAVTGRDVGVLIEADGSDADAKQTHWLASWNVNVVALSDAANRLHLLRRAAIQQPLIPDQQQPLRVQEGEQYFSINLLPIQDLSRFGAGYFVILSDISEAVKRIHAGTQRSLLLGALGILLSELVLFMILSAPLTRLQRTARVLPLLAQNRFDAVRVQLQRHQRGWGLDDEIDNLDNTAINLAFQLEALNDKVREHTEALKLRMQDLDRERGFIASLLDTAQVLIVTQDRQGRIGLANRFTLQVTGFELAELVGRPFKDLLNPQESQVVDLEMVKLIRHQGQHYSHEAELVCATGRQLQLAWFHSALDTQDEDGAVVLSAGLDITERKQSERRIAWLADHDPLTGLVNRRRFEETLKQALRKGMDNNENSGALLYVDLDQFKLINDTLGHSAGDRMLEAFAGNLARLSGIIAPRRNSMAARLGGDEFAVIVEDADRDSALAMAERLRDDLSALEYMANAEMFRITSSIGVALYPEHGVGVQELMQNADLAMYQAKSLGEGRVQLFSGDEAMRARMAHRLRWKERIDDALNKDRLTVYFQPILELDSGLISHYEALVRMLGPHGECVPPADFIPVAEATGQIIRIDCRVLELVFDAWTRLHAKDPTLGIHINLSARAFQTFEWWARLNCLLDESAAEPSCLVFEITETAAVTDLKDAKNLMEAIRHKGCRFALDDFGVGFSSFNYVKELPVDLVKIDGAFITRLAERHDSQLVVKALVDVARGFGKRTVAEFVDSADTLEMLRTLKVDYAQGFYIGKPLPEQQLTLDRDFTPGLAARGNR